MQCRKVVHIRGVLQDVLGHNGAVVMADDQPEPQAAAENLGQRAEVGLSDKILLWQPGKSALDEPRTLAQFQLSLPCCHDPPRRCEAPPPASPGEEQIFTRTAPASVS